LCLQGLLFQYRDGLWSIVCERGLPPSSSEAMPTLVILVPATVTVTDSTP
jgi:hypothetical protein